MFTGSKLMPDDETEIIRTLCEQSQARLPLADQAEVEAAFRAPGTVGVLNNVLANEIPGLLASPTRTGFDTHDLRRIRNGFQLEKAIGQSHQQWDAVLDAVLYPLQAGTELKKPDDPAWPRAIDLARGLGVDCLPANMKLAALSVMSTTAASR
jgi:hypothetical protein